MRDRFLRRFTDASWSPTRDELHAYLDALLAPGASHGGKESAAFLAVLATRPLCAETIVDFVDYVQRRSPVRALPGVSGAVNIVGTGGGRPTFNISTAAALVAAAAGATVVKSGSRAYTSESGSIDVLCALRIPLPGDPGELAAMVRDTGIGFASEAHGSPVLRRLAASIHPLPWRDVAGFVNTIGPLLSPYAAAGQVIGVARGAHFAAIALAARRLGARRTLLVHCSLGLDELCSFAPNRAEWIDVDSGPELASGPAGAGELGDLAGGDPARNAEIVTDILHGRLRGAARDTVVLNAGAALVVAGAAVTIADGASRAGDAIDSGAARACLARVAAWRAAAPRAEASGS
jgi:anthranilate phosphoribosyltransferase